MDHTEAMRIARIPDRAQRTTLAKLSRLDLRALIQNNELVDEEFGKLSMTLYSATPDGYGRGRFVAQVFLKELILSGEPLTQIVNLSFLCDEYRHESFASISALFSMSEYVLIQDFFIAGTPSPMQPAEARAIENCILQSIDDGRAVLMYGSSEPRHWSQWWSTSFLKHLENVGRSLAVG